MTDTSRDPEAEADSFDPSRGGYNVTWERYCALLTHAETAEGRLAEAVKGLRKLDRRMDTLDTFDLRVHEIVSETLAKIKGETNDE